MVTVRPKNMELRRIAFMIGVANANAIVWKRDRIHTTEIRG